MGAEHAYESNVAIGAKYSDLATGFAGTCCCVAFYADGPARVQLAGLKTDGSVAREWFDEPSMVPEPTGL